MPDSTDAAVAALAGATTETVGRFRYNVTNRSWWWSSSMYTIHGFAPGEVVPSTALISSHQHADDRAGAIELLTATLTAGKPFCSRHRILDARRRVRTVVTIGQGIPDRDGHIVQIRGYLIDVTDALNRDLADATERAVEHSAKSRSAIEQAKGALMITYGLDDHQAFAMLRWHSQHTNIKLRDIAVYITERTNDPQFTDLTAPARISRILNDLADNHPPTHQPTDNARQPPEENTEQATA